MNDNLFPTEYCGQRLDHPVCAAAGYAKNARTFSELLESATSMIEFGSIIVGPKREGNRGQTYWSDKRLRAFNALGIPCESEEYYRAELPRMIRETQQVGKVFALNIAGFSPEDYVRGAELAIDCGAHVLVVNFGCPNLWQAGVQKEIISHSAFRVFEILRAISNRIGFSIPVDIKISPIEHLADRKTNLDSLWECIASFPMVQAVTALNTVPNKCGIDGHGAPCIISPDVPTGSGGMSGRIMKPLALWYASRLAYLARNSPVTIRACGGVTTGADVADFLGIGGGKNGKVVAVQVGAAVHDFGPRVLSDILQQWVEYEEEMP